MSNEVLETTEEWIRRVRREIHEETQSMTSQEKREYYRKGSDEFHHLLEKTDTSKFNFDTLKNRVKAARSVETEQLVRWIRDEIYEETKDMILEERREYVSKRSEDLRKQWNNSKSSYDFSALRKK